MSLMLVCCGFALIAVLYAIHAAIRERQLTRLDHEFREHADDALTLANSRDLDNIDATVQQWAKEIR